MSAGTLEKPFVAAISGTSGAGKSTLVARLAAHFPNSVRYSFDDYVKVENTAEAIREWLANGAPPAAYRTPGLVAELRRVVTDPRGTEIVLVEEPFGRARPELAPWIDFSIFLELPAEIALARRIVRTLEDCRQQYEKLVPHVAADLKTYLACGRDAYAAADRAARSSADFVVSGEQPAETVFAMVAAAIERTRRARRKSDSPIARRTSSR